MAPAATGRPSHLCDRIARFEARRDAVLNEANAIGTTALRGQLASVPDHVRLRGATIHLADMTERQKAPMLKASPHALITAGWFERLARNAMALTTKDTAMGGSRPT
jgi:hypothetical protein